MVLGNFQCWGGILIWIIPVVGQGPTPLTEGAGGSVWTFFLSLWKKAPYRSKYCPKELLNPKQPTNPSYETVESQLLIQFLWEQNGKQF